MVMMIMFTYDVITRSGSCLALKPTNNFEFSVSLCLCVCVCLSNIPVFGLES